MNYIKYDNIKFVLTDDGIKPEGDNRLLLIIKNDNYAFDFVKDAFNYLYEIVIYGCIIQNDGRQTDEYIAAIFNKTTKLMNISYDIKNDTFTLVFVEPDIVDQRLTTLETEVEEIKEELPPLTSPFTTNTEPTGVATRYYDVTELIAIYNENQPITVKVTTPISYKQPILLNLNCELYLGGN